MKRKQIKQVYMRQMQDRVLAVLADLYYNNNSISWNQLLTMINFLNANKEYGPDGIDTVITQLCKINIRILYFLGESTSVFLQEGEKSKKDYQKQMISYLNHSVILKEKVESIEEYKAGKKNIEEVGIPVLLENKGDYYDFKSLDAMVGRQRMPLFDRIANDFSVIREIVDQNISSLHSFVLRKANTSLLQAEVFLNMDSFDDDLSDLQESCEVLKGSINEKNNIEPSVIETIRLNNEDSCVKDIYRCTLHLESNLEKCQEFLVKQQIRIFELRKHLLDLKEKMEIVFGRITDLDKKFYLHCYIYLIDQALVSQDICEMERVANGVIVKKKEKKEKKLA